MVADGTNTSAGVEREFNGNVVAVAVSGDVAGGIVGDPVAAAVIPAPASDDGFGGVVRIGGVWGGNGFDEGGLAKIVVAEPLRFHADDIVRLPANALLQRTAGVGFGDEAFVGVEFQNAPSLSFKTETDNPPLANNAISKKSNGTSKTVTRLVQFALTKNSIEFRSAFDISRRSDANSCDHG